MRIESRYAEVLHIAAECAAENAALKAEAEWAGATIALLIGENENLHADLDDMQAEWAKETEERKNKSFVSPLQWRLREKIDRIAELESRLAEKCDHADTQSKLLQDCKAHILGLDAALAEAQRQKVAAFERNAELERRIAQAVNAVRNATGNAPMTDSSLILLIIDRLEGPRAPSVPRRETPGMEVEI